MNLARLGALTTWLLLCVLTGSLAAGDKPAAKPAKPKSAAKPAIKPKNTTDAKPADQKAAAAPRS